MLTNIQFPISLRLWRLWQNPKNLPPPQKKKKKKKIEGCPNSKLKKNYLRVAKCYGYDGYIHIKILKDWG